MRTIDLPRSPSRFDQTAVLRWMADTSARLREWSEQNANIDRTFGQPATVADAGSAYAFNLRGGLLQLFDLTLTQNCTFTLTGVPRSPNLFRWLVALRQGGTGSYTVTWPTGTKWAGATPPTLSTAVGRVDLFEMLTYDGGTVVHGRTYTLDSR